MDISANCTAKNEEIYIEASMASLAPYVREVIFIDHYSFDNTLAVAKKCSQKWPNIKIIEISKGLNYADVRNKMIENSSSDLIMKWDADCILTNKEHLAEKLHELRKSSAVALPYSYYNMCYDGRSYYESHSTELYVFKKGKAHYECVIEGPNKYGDWLVVEDKKFINTDRRYFVHACDIKPLLNILFRCFMSEYHTDPNPDKGDYFTWYWKKKNPDGIPTKEGVIENIVSAIKYLLGRPLETRVKNAIVKRANDSNNEEIKNFYKIPLLDLFVINDKLIFEKTILIMYRGKMVCYPEENWEEKLRNVLCEMDSNGDKYADIF